jgi:HK97 gp10 family phage protein
MDGVTKQLADYFEKLETLGDLAVEAIKEQIDLEAAAVETALRENTPTDTGGLAASLTRTDIDTPKHYGKRLEYEGENAERVSYEKIANILNYGTSTIKPRRFVGKAIKRLKGLDDRAAQRFEEKINTEFSE